MVYCDKSMCDSKLGRLMQAFRADRPDEWTMDEFIGMAEALYKERCELLAALESMFEAEYGYGLRPSYDELAALLTKAQSQEGETI